MPTDGDPDREMDRYTHDLMAGAAEGILASCEDLVGQAILLAPIEEGTLRGTGHAPESSIELDRTGSTIVGTVSFSTVYAARQHEELDYEHPRGGQAKYLEQPFREMMPRYTRAIQAAAQRRTNRRR